jgi:hypothetical protein
LLICRASSEPRGAADPVHRSARTYPAVPSRGHSRPGSTGVANR